MGKTKPLVMGILNVTPDSFSDGGTYFDPEHAISYGIAMIEEGADIIDVGGESTRPGSKEVDSEEERRRVVPVVKALAARNDIVISIDTKKPSVAREAIEAGARIINDVSMLRHGTELASIARDSDAELILMHSRKTPQDMQADIVYNDVVRDVIDELSSAAEKAEAVGLEPSKIWLDPGIGFAKTVTHNFELLARLDELVELGYPVLVGPSRKSFIGKTTGAETDQRHGGTAAAVTASILCGARAVRVHDVSMMRQVVVIAAAIGQAGGLAAPDLRQANA
jgi:dihydropteroate synthase